MKYTLLRIAIGSAALIACAAGIGSFLASAPPASAKRNVARAPEVSRDPVALACPGRVEGRSDAIAVGAATEGVVQSVFVKEGQTVSQGQVLAEIGCNDLRAALQVAQAEAESVRQARVRLLRGSRDQERQAAAQRTAAARAVVEHAAAELDRATALRDAAAISTSAYDQARRNYEVAEAELKQAMRNEELVDAGPLAEEVAKADADLEAAENRIRLAQDKLSKCVVRAPIAGTILRVDLRQGESFSLYAPHPLFTVADLTGRRVRAEVDEHDVGKVHAGQKALVSSEAYPNRRFSGTVTRLASIMGRKTVETGNPADKSDRDILEAVVDLDQDALVLPIGLRVTVEFVR
jgi:HlyD family secretion protein